MFEENKNVDGDTCKFFYLVGDVALANIVKLLIIDEVHLLHSDRGPVVEAIVARTLRQVSQNVLSTYCY